MRCNVRQPSWPNISAARATQLNRTTVARLERLRSELLPAALAITLCLTAAFAQAAGFRLIEVPADADGPALKGAMYYPCSEPPGEIHLDPNIGLITPSERATHLGRMLMPSAESVAAVDANLPAKHEYHVVPNSTHFAFLFICPPGLEEAVRSACRRGLVSRCSPEPEKNVREICTDTPGFDRVAFHKQFNVDVLTFVQAHLPKAPRP
jgi:hypothetical protein